MDSINAVSSREYCVSNPQMPPVEVRNRRRTISRSAASRPRDPRTSEISHPSSHASGATTPIKVRSAAICPLARHPSMSARGELHRGRDILGPDASEPVNRKFGKRRKFRGHCTCTQASSS
jgi:hypothetical protein